MALTLKEAASFVMSEAEEGIGWIAFWKKGRGWGSMDFYPAYNEHTDTLVLDDRNDKKLLEKIIAMDPNAIIVNSYYDNLGDVYNLTPMKLGRALHRLYDAESDRITDKKIIYKEKQLWKQ